MESSDITCAIATPSTFGESFSAHKFQQWTCCQNWGISLGENMESGGRPVRQKADLQPQFKMSKKKRFKRKNSKSLAEDWELPGKHWFYLELQIMTHRNCGFWPETGLYCLSGLLEFRDSTLVNCVSQRPGNGNKKCFSPGSSWLTNLTIQWCLMEVELQNETSRKEGLGEYGQLQAGLHCTSTPWDNFKYCVPSLYD